MDAEAYRAESRERWGSVAAGWEASREFLQRAAAPVSKWMVDAIHPQPGDVVLELAAGAGDTGLLAVERVRPGGHVIVTDGVEAMLDVARARAAELGMTDEVELRQMDAEWIDLPAATIDGVLCRWAYMLLADPETALRETRRVLKQGGRVALAAWDVVERNPWMGEIRAEVAARGLMEPPPPDEPGPYSFARPGRIEELLDATGFDDVEVSAIDFHFEASSLDDYWEHTTRTSPTLGPVVRGLSPADHYALRDAIDARFAPYVQTGGTVRIPARTLVAAASA
jgi:SAM-dependent methyltransferase